MKEDKYLRDKSLIIDRPNKRIKIMDSQLPHLKNWLGRLPDMATREKTGKITIYSRKSHADLIQFYGYQMEGKIDGFFNGKNAYIFSCYPDSQRGISHKTKEEDKIVEHAQNKEKVQKAPLPAGLCLRAATKDDVDQLVDIFRKVFPVYPTPVHNPKYLNMMLETNVDFMVIEKDGRIISVASAEITEENRCAELTDCATHPDYRGQGLLSYLFFALEEHLENNGIYYLFSLTRAISPPMNITVAKHGYQYRGRLINNCVISTGFEDMNIWVKPLRSTRD